MQEEKLFEVRFAPPWRKIHSHGSTFIYFERGLLYLITANGYRVVPKNANTYAFWLKTLQNNQKLAYQISKVTEQPLSILLTHPVPGARDWAKEKLRD